MLNITKSVSVNAYSAYEGKTAVTYSATINGDNPESISPSTYIQDSALYKEHREEFNTERTQFEDFVFAEQEKLIAEKKAKDEEDA